MSAATDIMAGEAPPKAARTGIWSIRPQQALRWRHREPSPDTVDVEATAELGAGRVVMLVGLVLAAATAGGVAAWALFP